ncbi:MAG: PAS domain-containing protein [Anaerolineae bacterium]|nr:PAS domain-containing protein [Anaerolineae bacterium]
MRDFFGRFDVRVSAVYAVVAGLWIVVSDTLLGLLVDEAPTSTTISLAKGLGFVAVTTLALFSVLRVELQKRARVEQALQDDIAERKLAEDVLLETTQTMQAIIAASPLPIITLDTDARVRVWNPAAERVFGWRAVEALGAPNPIIPDDLVVDFGDLLGVAAQGTQLSGLEMRLWTKAGRRST